MFRCYNSSMNTVNKILLDLPLLTDSELEVVADYIVQLQETYRVLNAVESVKNG